MRLQLALAALVHAQAVLVLGQLSVSSASFAVLNSVGITSSSSEFSSSAPAPLKPTTLQDGDVLKLAFVVNDGETPIQPHQAMLAWVPTAAPVSAAGSKARQDWLSTVKVRKGGKGRWELDISRAPHGLLSLPTPLALELLVGHFSAPEALRIPLGTFDFAPQLTAQLAAEPTPAGWEVDRFAPMPEITWTERAKEKTVRSPLAFLGLVVVLSPWLIYLGAIAHLEIPLSISAPSSLAFLSSLAAFEILLALYWLSDTVKLIPTLPYFFLIALATALSGRRALGVLQRKREGKATKSE